MENKINCLFYSLLAPLITHQIHYLAFRMDNMTLWFYRYLSGGLFLFLFTMIFKRSEIIRFFSSGKTLSGIVIYAFMLIASSIAFSEGVKMTNATTGNLFCAVSLPLTMGAAYVMWREESDLFKDYFFHAGLITVLAGALGFSLGGGRFTDGNNFALGSFMLLGGVIISCFGTLLIKNLLLKNDPMVVSGIGMSTACAILFVPTCFSGSINILFVSPAETVCILLFSGIFGAFTGFFLGLKILKKSGVMIYNLIQLAIPLTSTFIGVSFLNEKFSAWQLFFAFFLLAGSYLCIKRKEKINPSPAEKSA